MSSFKPSQGNGFGFFVFEKAQYFSGLFSVRKEVNIVNTQELPICLRVEQVAEVLGVSKKTAYSLVKAENLAIRVGPKRLVVPRDRFVRFLEQSGV
ncbi:MAG: helix-turn-helix domain-containing protein [Candidatus Contubernalis sp.]|nr:helix-turn-helix domain-containing protein [Candidatus Contubernalis sp.]